MPTVNLTLTKELFAEKFYPQLDDWSNRWLFLCGSAGSGKSYFATQKVIYRCLREPVRILVCRRYGTTLRQTCFSLFKSVIKQWKLTPYIKVNESDMRLTFPNGAQVIFLGLDDESKLLSLNDISTIIIEEATEVPKDIVEQLNLRMRGQASGQQLILCWNPISRNHWLYDYVEINPPQSYTYIKSTYKDNPFLNKEYIEALEELYTRNPRKAKVFCDGEWGSDVEGLVFTNWHKESLNAMDLAKQFEHRVGMDFGYQDPSAIVDTFYDQKNNRIYVTNCFYQPGQRLDELYNAICNMQLNKSKIVCDSAEPRTIDYFKNKGVNAVPCVKGQGSVNARIAFLQNQEIIVDLNCKEVINELENFAYIKDKSSNMLTDRTTHEYSHSIDALGYAYSDIYKSNKLQTLDKALFGF